MAKSGSVARHTSAIRLLVVERGRQAEPFLQREWRSRESSREEEKVRQRPPSSLQAETVGEIKRGE